MLAAAQASRTAECSAWRDRSAPTRMGLLPPALALASTARSSPSRHVVLLPPPSMPRNQGMSVLYHIRRQQEAAVGSREPAGSLAVSDWQPRARHESPAVDRWGGVAGPHGRRPGAANSIYFPPRTSLAM